jgi:hypothetical protein
MNYIESVIQIFGISITVILIGLHLTLRFFKKIED